MKVCSRCKRELPMTTEYFGKLSKSKDGFKYSCKECRRKIEYTEDKQHILELRKVYYEDNKVEILKKNEIYKNKNKTKYQEYKAKYYENNKQLVKDRVRDNSRNRRKTDIGYKLLCYYRTRIYEALQGRTDKTKTTKELIGCSIEELKEHLKSQFTEGMSWDNYGEWHVDHIKPCATFDFRNESELNECFNYKNLQPLWAKDNLQKSSKYIESTL